MTLWSLLNLMRSLRLKLPLLQKESLAKSGHTHHPRRSRLPATGQIWTPMSSTTSSGLPPQKPTALSAARPRDEQEICRAAETAASERLHIVAAVVEEVDPLWFNANAPVSFEPIDHLPDTLMLVAVKRL
eukprot:CAMPEP_0172700512 /NCGR_PEP_ID=MMETSP1074-20121228/30959_1 /TAXON_ID=2916 /ORGANISM="Ceratium fusus, Strain PA161109" /LENGTH=129 /DNA_ID=CAMNT_0013521901 /DNA_START=146 /DNA_END=531 /DNA_ORIENTATION=+